MEKKKKVINMQEGMTQKLVEGMRPPINIRDQLDIGYTFEKQVIEILEIRPKWDDPETKMSVPVARARFIKSRKIWKVYWMRASGKWEPYEPGHEVRDVAQFVKIVKEDALGCFFG